MRYKIFDGILGLMIFWIVATVFEGMIVKDGIAGYLIAGGLYGAIMVTVVPLINFFTLPIKFISIFLISIMLSVIIMSIFNWALPVLDFGPGEVVGLQNSYFEFPKYDLNKMGNIIVPGLVTGFFSTVLKWLSHD